MKRAPRPTATDSIEREYARLLLLYQKTYKNLVRVGLKDLLPRLRKEVSEQAPEALAERMDADASKAIATLFDMILGKMEKNFPETLLRRWAMGMASRTNKLTAKNQAKHARAATKHLKEGPVEILGILTSERKLSPYFKNIVDQNVALIRSIPAEKIPAFKNALTNAITQDLPVGQLAKIIGKHYAATENKARLIARDQVGKLNGALDEYHQRTIGIKKYTWRTMGDGSVRHDHAKLNGTTQRWDKPPVVDRKSGRRGHPKQDIQCRCYAEAQFDELLDV